MKSAITLTLTRSQADALLDALTTFQRDYPEDAAPCVDRILRQLKPGSKKGGAA